MQPDDINVSWLIGAARRHAAAMDRWKTLPNEPPGAGLPRILATRQMLLGSEGFTCWTQLLAEQARDWDTFNAIRAEIAPSERAALIEQMNARAASIMRHTEVLRLFWGDEDEA